MKSKLIVALLFASATAVAGSHDDLAAARQRVQAASTAVSYYEKETIIAERDIATARIHKNTASKAQSEALRAHDRAAASTWARRYDDAVKDERDAQARADRSRSDRDTAREDLRVANASVKRLEPVARASRQLARAGDRAHTWIVMRDPSKEAADLAQADEDIAAGEKRLADLIALERL